MFVRSSEAGAAKELLVSARRHGGRLAAARRAFPAAPAPWIDLSTGINPHPWRGVSPRHDGDTARRPDPTETVELERIAATAFGCLPENIAAVPGADIGLRLLPRLIRARDVAIVGPTYDGHREAWTAADTRVLEVSRADLGAVDADVIVVVNPNNPDGAVVGARELMTLAVRQRARKGWLVVDESFIEVTPEHSVAGAAGEGLIVLRSFGKFYGLPGHRLGFVLAGAPTIARVRALTGDWPVTAGAIKVGVAAYADEAWRTHTHVRLSAESTRLRRLLERHGFNIVGGTSLFQLAAHPAADRAFVALAGAGILVRLFDHNPQWLRFGLPTARSWKRLRAALEACP